MMIFYEEQNELKSVSFLEIQHKTLYANSILAMTQYAIQRPKFMRFINKSAYVEMIEELKMDFTFSAMLNSFPIVHQSEAAKALAFFMKCNLDEYLDFLKSNLGILFSEVEKSNEDGVMYFNEALPIKTNNIECMYYAAFSFILEFKTDRKLHLVFDDEAFPILVAQYLLDEYNFYVGMSNGALDNIKAPNVIERIPFGATQKDLKDDTLNGKIDIFRLLISKLSTPAHNYGSVKISDRSISIINNLFDFYWQEVEDNSIDDYRLIKYLITYIAPMIEDFNYLQNKHFVENTPHEMIIKELEEELKATKKDLSNMKEENTFLTKKVENFSKANAKLPSMQQKIAWLEDENELLKERLKDNQPIIIKENELNDEYIDSFIERLNVKRVGIIGGNEDWQDKVSQMIAVDVKITELNKIDSLKNCEVILINTGFISHTLYFAAKNANKKAVFMYTDTLNTDVLKKDLYLNYRDKI